MCKNRFEFGWRRRHAQDVAVGADHHRFGVQFGQVGFGGTACYHHDDVIAEQDVAHSLTKCIGKLLARQYGEPVADIVVEKRAVAEPWLGGARGGWGGCVAVKTPAKAWGYRPQHGWIGDEFTVAHPRAFRIGRL